MFAREQRNAGMGIIRKDCIGLGPERAKMEIPFSKAYAMPCIRYALGILPHPPAVKD